MRMILNTECKDEINHDSSECVRDFGYRGTIESDTCYGCDKNHVLDSRTCLCEHCHNLAFNPRKAIHEKASDI